MGTQNWLQLATRRIRSCLQNRQTVTLYVAAILNIIVLVYIHGTVMTLFHACCILVPKLAL